VPNDIENISNDIVRENDQNNTNKNTNANNNFTNKYSNKQNIRIDLGNRNNFPQNNAISNYPNIDNKSINNQNNINENNQNAPNAEEEEIINLNINTLDETVSETLVIIK
jgi:hypothetical protein